MSMQDPIADMLTRIRNAQFAGEEQAKMPCSNQKISILNVLQQEGYIAGFKKIELDKNKAVLEVTLKYYNNRPVIEKISRVSKPGLRKYKGSAELPIVKAGMGIAIISTPKGVMTGKSARKQNLGGEVICIVE